MECFLLGKTLKTGLFGVLGAFAALLAGLFQLPLTAQQNPQFSQYLQNPFVINPAITGVEDYVDLTASYRDQWSGFEGAPRTATFSANASLHLLKGRLQRREGESHQGAGIFVYTDDTGPIRQGGFFASYAYHLKVSRDWFVSMGTFLGATQLSYDDREAILIQNPNDILVQSFSSLNFDASLGLYAYSRYLFVGVAANRLLDREIPYDVDNGVLVTDGRLNRNYNLLLGSRIAVGSSWQLVSSVLIKTVAEAPVQWDLNAKVVLDNSFWLGVSYRWQDAVVGMAGFRIGQGLMASYSYDWTVTDFSNQQAGSHELILSYRFDFGNQRCNCPKYSL